MMAGVLGGVAMPHAPQFFTLPETEDRDTVEKVRTLAGEIGGRLAALEPDVWIVVANDHANQFFLHCTPPFTLHLGGEVTGGFAGRRFHHRVAGDTSLGLFRELQAQGFDPAFTNTAEIDYAFGIPLTFLNVGPDQPIIPIYVNAYVPPQPSTERCYAFGRAIARGLNAIGVRAVVVSSGGMSHFPGTDRYASPDLEFDRLLAGSLERGNLRAIMALDDRRLDETGNVELRSWAIAAGMLGERKPDVTSFLPSWHHTYCTLAWYEPTATENGAAAPHYPPIRPDRVRLTERLHRLANDPAERTRFLADPQGYAREADLSDAERAALTDLDERRLVALGVHPLVPFLARLQIERERRQVPAGST